MKVGIIGVGNMGGAIADALINKNDENLKIFLSGRHLKDYDRENVVVTDSVSLAKEVDYLILAVKPNVYPEVISEIREHLREDAIFISIAAGQSKETLKKMLGDRKFVLSMPNTPALVEEAMSAICPENLNEEEISEVKEIFESFGRVCVIDEKVFDSYGAVVGTLPAYVYMFIESLADAAVIGGLKRDLAYEFIAQTVLGSAKMVLETKKHPGELKDMVTSPGGTTIEGVRTLEEKGFRAAVIDAVIAAREKSLKMRGE